MEQLDFLQKNLVINVTIGDAGARNFSCSVVIVVAVGSADVVVVIGGDVHLLLPHINWLPGLDPLFRKIIDRFTHPSPESTHSR